MTDNIRVAGKLQADVSRAESAHRVVVEFPSGGYYQPIDRIDRLSRRTKVMNIYVGNLSYGTTDDDLRAAFAPYGAITSARVVMDKETGRSRGFGFVEMASQSEALAAIDALNQTELQGRQLRINEARPKR